MKYRVHGHGLTAFSTMPLERQAEVIHEANRELFTPQNLRRSELSQQIQYQVQKPFINLINTKSNKSVLFAFPFMIVGGADTILLEVVDTLNQNDYEISLF